MPKHIGKHGRVSMDALMLRDTGLAAELPRPDAPYELDDEESVVWRDVVESMPADHFIPANYHLLTQLCRHIVEARRIEQLVKDYRSRKNRTDFNYKTYAELQKVLLSQTQMIQRLSCSMRLTQQANFRQNRRLPKPTINNDEKHPSDENW